MIPVLRRLAGIAGSQVHDRRGPNHVHAPGLLCALVLAPSALPRNRFFSLFAGTETRALRVRASELRGAIRHLAGRTRATIRLDELEPPGHDGLARVRYRLPAIKLERSMWLDPLELALVRVAIDRICCGLGQGDLDRAMQHGALADSRLAVTHEDRNRVDEALVRLWHTLTQQSAASEGSSGPSTGERDS